MDSQRRAGPPRGESSTLTVLDICMRKVIQFGATRLQAMFDVYGVQPEF